MPKAPEPGILKRQRSRPSDWWAAKPTAPVAAIAQAQVPAHGSSSGDGEEGSKQNAGVETKRVGERKEGGIKDAMGAGNRGRIEEKDKLVRRERSSAGDADIRALGEGLGESVGEEKTSKGAKKSKNKGGEGIDQIIQTHKPVRRGRSNAGDGESGILGEASGDAAAIGGRGKKRGRRAASKAEEDPLGDDEEPVKPKKRGRPSNARVEEQADELVGEQPVLKKRGRISAGSDGQENESVAAVKRRSRLSLVVAEDQADELVGDEPRQGAVKGKRGRPSGGQSERSEEQAIEQVVSKKRGRPAASRVEDQGDELVAKESGMDAAPKKRGRPPAASTAEEAEDQLSKPSKKRGRPPPSHTERATNSSATNSQHQATKKRGRSAVVITDVEIVFEAPESRRRTPRSDAEVLKPVENTPARGRTRHRRSDVIEPESSQPKAQKPKSKENLRNDVQAEEGNVENRGGRRTRRSDGRSQQNEAEPMAGLPRKPTKSGRRSEVVEVQTASSRLTKTRGDKQAKPASNAAPAKKGSSSTQISTKAKKGTRLSNATSSAPSQTHKKASKRNYQVEAPSRKRKGDENTEPAPSNRQRIEKAPEQDHSNDAEVDRLDYQHFKAVTRNVPRQTIEAKWEALPPTAIERISQLLSDLQRPVIARLNDERKKTQASTAVEGISRKLLQKIYLGLPFPPGTRNHREDDFDFEKILDHNRALEAQLTPALHSNELLEAELSKEMAKLESDKELLAELETNAKAEALARNQAARKLHSVLQLDDSTEKIELMKDDIGLTVDRQPQSLDLGIQDDEDLQGLAKELSGHVESVQGNIKQVRGISRAMANSRAAVQATLFDHLDSSHYDDVVLGAEKML